MSATVMLSNPLPETFDVEGLEVLPGHVVLIGTATHVGGWTYRCLARVGAALCVVEVSLKEFQEKDAQVVS